MLKVNKKSEPEEFTKYKSKNKIINWDSFSTEIKQVLKQYLLEEQENRCCPYCEIEINLEELIKIASELVKDRGYFYLVHRADRLSEIMSSLQKYKFEAKKIKFCYTTKYKNAKIVLIEAIKNGKAGLTILPSLIINKENGEYTDEILKMFE